MGKVIFSSPTNSVQVKIRQECGYLCAQAMESSLDLTALLPLSSPFYTRQLEVFKEMLPKLSYLRTCIDTALKDATKIDGNLHLKNLQDHISVNFRVNDGFLLNENIHIFSMMLDTALTLGGDALKLAARIYGQSEIHGWIDKKNKSVVANIIKDALDTGIYSQDNRWQQVVHLLLEENTTPVVMSYSVCTEFPEYQNDADSSLSKQEQWDLGFDKLQEKPWLELNFDTWENYSFDRWDAFKFNQLMNWAGDTVNNPDITVDRAVTIITEITKFHTMSNSILTNKESWDKTIKFVDQQGYNLKSHK